MEQAPGSAAEFKIQPETRRLARIQSLTGRMAQMIVSVPWLDAYQRRILAPLPSLFWHMLNYASIQASRRRL